MNINLKDWSPNIKPKLNKLQKSSKLNKQTFLFSEGFFKPTEFWLNTITPICQISVHDVENF